MQKLGWSQTTNMSHPLERLHVLKCNFAHIKTKYLHFFHGKRPIEQFYLKKPTSAYDLKQTRLFWQKVSVCYLELKLWNIHLNFYLF